MNLKLDEKALLQRLSEVFIPEYYGETGIERTAFTSLRQEEIPVSDVLWMHDLIECRDRSKFYCAARLTKPGIKALRCGRYRKGMSDMPKAKQS